MAVGKSVNRTDAVAKVTGRAEYTEDIFRPDMLEAKYVRSTIAHGRVTHINTEKAEQLPGVEAVFTYKDVPDRVIATAGHPFSMDPSHKDVEDRLLLTGNVRYMGDEVAIVVAEDALIADQAVKLVEVTYEEYKPLTRPEDILAEDAMQIHEGSSNVIGEHTYECGGVVDDEMDKADHVTSGKFVTTMVQHCHIENHIAFAYMDDLERIVVVTSTQIPHIARRIVGEALSIPLSRVRVVKPYLGGGFGNKQDVVLEPIVAFLTTKLDGRAVRINMTREECMLCTRNRHPFHIEVKTGFSSDGKMVSRDMDAISLTGGYASHGHAIAAAGGSKNSYLYPRMAVRYHARTIYANIPVAGAMRAYGTPQVIFAGECAIDDAARKIGMDPVDFRLKNAAMAGDIDQLRGKEIISCGLVESLEKGREIIDWDRKKKEYANDTGSVRRGLGVACFSYASGTYPVCVEIAGVRLVLNQDGSVHVQVGATEIGQGSDTITAQMAAETLGIPYEKIIVVQAQDTDVSPFDTGAYASRQAYVVSNAMFRAASELKEKIIRYGAELSGQDGSLLDIQDGNIVEKGTGKTVMSVEEIAMDSYYHKERGGQLTAEVSHKTTTNAPVFGCTFVDLTVNIALCQVTINQIINIHDSGKIINPVQARGQIHGGAAMGIAAALSEELMIDEETGYVYNNNLLDYKIPTFSDLPQIGAEFVETFEPTSGYGNKSLGEPPLISPPPAIRNAILDATGIAINTLPMSPHVLFSHFKESGLIDQVCK